MRLPLVSWTMSKKEMDIRFRSENGIHFARNFFQEHIEWKINELRSWIQEDTYSSGTFQTVNYEIEIERTGTTVTVTIIIPGVIVTALALLYIALPINDNQRLPYLNMVLLSVIMFLVMMSEVLPVLA